MARWWNSKRFDLVEVGLISFCVALGAYLVQPQAAPGEAAALEAAYGPDRFSENEEEWIIRDFFKDRRNGFFVDVGANHYRVYSNTYYLESRLGWSGLAIEPLRQFEADYAVHRPRTRFFPFYVSDTSDEQVTMYALGENFLVTSSDRTFVERFGENPHEVVTPTVTLDDLFERENVTTVDFMSIDIELSEPKALAGLDIDRYRPALVCIEAHPEVRQQILDYFTSHHYVIIGKYLRADGHNLWFSPLETGT